MKRTNHSLLVGMFCELKCSYVLRGELLVSTSEPAISPDMSESYLCIKQNTLMVDLHKSIKGNYKKTATL
jgi:hypothetical protein